MVKYVGAMMQLERVLSGDKRALDLLAQKLQGVERQLLHFDICESQIIASLADVYGEVISPLGPKIQVFGKPELLKQTSTQQKIRHYCSPGSAVRYCGGN